MGGGSRPEDGTIYIYLYIYIKSLYNIVCVYTCMYNIYVKSPYACFCPHDGGVVVLQEPLGRLQGLLGAVPQVEMVAVLREAVLPEQHQAALQPEQHVEDLAMKIDIDLYIYIHLTCKHIYIDII